MRFPRVAQGALPALTVLGLTVLGLVLRLIAGGQSLFADELSTYWVVSEHGLGGVVSTVHTDAEISPPLYFVLAWLTTRLDLTAELLRAPSLLAGVAAIPLTYVFGLRTVGRSPGVVASAFVALSPFMIFYSSEARGYAVGTVLVLLSTLAILNAVGDGRARWWVAYAGLSSAAVYTHYTMVFALATQLAWALWAHPEARRSVLLANVGAAVCFLPWLGGLIADFNSGTKDILDALAALSLDTLWVTLKHWAIGYPLVLPNTSPRSLPGIAALLVLALGVGAALVDGARAWWRRRPHARPGRSDGRLLIGALVIGPPVGIVLASLVGTDLLSVRHLAPSWPAFAVALAALLLAAGPRLRVASVALVVACFAIGAAKMLEPRFERPAYRSAAEFVQSQASEVVIDGTNLSPAPLTAMDVALGRSKRIFYLGRFRVQYDPFKILAGPPAPEQVAERALSVADGEPVLVVSSERGFASGPLAVNPAAAAEHALGAAGYRVAERRAYPGILRIAVSVYAPGPSARR